MRTLKRLLTHIYQSCLKSSWSRWRKILWWG